MIFSDDGRPPSYSSKVCLIMNGNEGNDDDDYDDNGDENGR